jgi:hypothetical protein
MTDNFNYLFQYLEKKSRIIFGRGYLFFLSFFFFGFFQANQARSRGIAFRAHSNKHLNSEN